MNSDSVGIYLKELGVRYRIVMFEFLPSDWNLKLIFTQNERLYTWAREVQPPTLRQFQPWLQKTLPVLVLLAEYTLPMNICCWIRSYISYADISYYLFTFCCNATIRGEIKIIIRPGRFPFGGVFSGGGLTPDPLFSRPYYCFTIFPSRTSKFSIKSTVKSFSFPEP